MNSVRPPIFTTYCPFHTRRRKSFELVLWISSVTPQSKLGSQKFWQWLQKLSSTLKSSFCDSTNPRRGLKVALVTPESKIAFPKFLQCPKFKFDSVKLLQWTLVANLIFKSSLSDHFPSLPLKSPSSVSWIQNSLLQFL